MVYYSVIGQLSFLGEISILRHFYETTHFFKHWISYLKERQLCLHLMLFVRNLSPFGYKLFSWDWLSFRKGSYSTLSFLCTLLGFYLFKSFSQCYRALPPQIHIIQYLLYNYNFWNFQLLWFNHCNMKKYMPLAIYKSNYRNMSQWPQHVYKKTTFSYIYT